MNDTDLKKSINETFAHLSQQDRDAIHSFMIIRNVPGRPSSELQKFTEMYRDFKNARNELTETLNLKRDFKEHPLDTEWWAHVANLIHIRISSSKESSKNFFQKARNAAVALVNFAVCDKTLISQNHNYFVSSGFCELSNALFVALCLDAVNYIEMSPVKYSSFLFQNFGDILKITHESKNGGYLVGFIYLYGSEVDTDIKDTENDPFPSANMADLFEWMKKCPI